MERSVTQAIEGNAYGDLSAIFSSTPSSTSWQSLGQGEQRTLAAHFIKLAITSKTFLPSAFSSEEAVEVINKALGHLPPSVENAYDNQLRNALFTYLVEEEEDYRAAAAVLADCRMEDMDENSVYYTTPQDKTDVYVKIAECFLNEDDIVEADTFVTKAGGSVQSIQNPKDHVALILRYKTCYARVLDSNRKFLQAAGRYHDLSLVGSQTDIVHADELVEFLGKAATCAILAPRTAQCQRILGLIFKDERLGLLDAIQHFQTHSAILTKMYMNQVIRRDDDLDKFEKSLAEHQTAIMGDGLTILDRALIEHNMVAASQLYASIYFTNLAHLLGVSAERAEKVASKMIMDGSLEGSIDQVEGLLNFQMEKQALVNWDESITSFCVQLNRVTDAVRQL